MVKLNTTSQEATKCRESSINIAGVSKSFGKVRALENVSLDIQAGIVFALLGPNGSGKTTIVRILTTLLRPDTGYAKVGGFDVVREPDSVRPIIGLAGQYPAVDENLTGKENLIMIGQLYHLGSRKSKERSQELLEIFDLIEAANRRARTYSGGMRRRLDLAAALIANPPILFLDEPTTGLDPRSRIGLWDVISRQAQNCNTVLLTTQYLEEADRLANSVAIMDQGHVVRVGTPQDLKSCCGGDTRIKIRLVNRNDISQVIPLLGGSGNGKVSSDIHTGEISLPAPEGLTALNDIVIHLEQARIPIAEIGLQQPTLDDVFLSITGHPAEAETPQKPLVSK